MKNRRTIMFHTSSKIIPSIEAHFSDACAQLNVRHVVDEPMLDLLQAEGFMSYAAMDILERHLVALTTYSPDCVICTCTTLSPAIRAIRDRYEFPISTVDEHMIAEIHKSYKNLLLILTSPSTKEATLQEFYEYFPNSGIQHIYVDGALDASLAGDNATHNDLLAVAINQRPEEIDAIVLPQSSMIVALDVLRTKVDLPIYNGLESALANLLHRTPKDPES